MGSNYPGKKKSPDGVSSEQTVYLQDGWFPVNGKLLRGIQENIQKGHYSDSRALVEEVSRDFSLFAYTLRGYLSLLDVQKRDQETNPFRMLQCADLATLSSILSVGEEGMSSHSLSEMSREQGLCLKNALLSSSTAALLAEHAGVDKGMTFSAALLRQVGLNLVAWNFPRIYSKALSSVSSEGSGNLECQLTKVLGFSPRSAGVRLTLPGPVHPGLLTMLGEFRQQEDEEQIKMPEVIQLATKFCTIGETFAKVSDPEHFPISQRDWNEVLQEINHYLGSDGVSKILTHVNGQLVNYASVTPKSFDVSLSPEKNVKLSGLYYGKRLLAGNPYIPKCNDFLRTKFQAVYSAMAPGEVSIRALEILLSEVIPWAGFTRGCIYIMDKDETYLIPRLKIGDGTIKRYKPIRCETEVLIDHPIANALFSSIPIKQKDILLHGERVSHISGPIGSSGRNGVLYLEMSDSAADSLDNEQMVFFRAIQQAVNDCLGI